jgi:menaquinone-9 beta-reductase
VQPAEPYDVAIVGARIGGSVLAAFLGDAGHRVLIVDRARFPSDTISTHFFRGGGLAGVLGELELLREVDRAGAPHLDREYVYADGAAEPTIDEPQTPGTLGYNLSVRRVTLDELLVRRAARSPSVELREGTVVTGLVRAADRVEGIRIGDEDVRARWVVAADGHASLVAREIDPPMQEQHDPIRALYFVYVTGFARPDGGAAPDGPEFSFLGDELAYVFPSDAGVTCVALSVNLAAFPQLRSGGLTAFRDRIRHHHGIWPRFEAATITGRLLGRGPQRSTVRVPAGPGWALVGDAGMHQDPWTGEGMDSAARSARALAEILDEHLHGRLSEDDVVGRYHAARDDQGIEDFHYTVENGRDLRALA